MPLGRAVPALAAGRVPARPLAVARIVLGVAAVVRGVEAMRILGRFELPEVMRVPYAALPAWWPGPPTGMTLRLVLALWISAAVLFAVGKATRPAGAVLVAVCAYVLTSDQQAYSNHLYLLTILLALVTLGDGGAALSLDARDRGQVSDRATVPAWPVVLLKCQVSIVYGFAALQKLRPAYLSGATLAAVVRPDVRAVTPPAVFLLLSLASIAAEAFLAVALWSPDRRVRRAACVLGPLLHAGMLATLPLDLAVQFAVFAAELLALYPLFGAGPRQVAAPRAPASPRSTHSRGAAVAGAAAASPARALPSRPA